MKLDKRISEQPFHCFDSNDASCFLGEWGYFSNSLENYSDLSKTVKSVLDEIDLGSSKPFKTKVSHKYRFFVPESFLE